MKRTTLNFYYNNYKKQILEIPHFINNKVYFLKLNIPENNIFRVKIKMRKGVFSPRIL